MRFGAGQNVLEAGGGGRLLYVLLEGTVEVLAPPARFGRQRRIGRLEAGSLVGEAPRPCRAGQAREPATVRIWPHQDGPLRPYPFFFFCLTLITSSRRRRRPAAAGAIAV